MTLFFTSICLKDRGGWKLNIQDCTKRSMSCREHFILIWSTFTCSMQLLFCYHSRTFLLAKLLASALPLSYKMSDGGSDTQAQIPVQYYVFGYYRLMDLFLVLNIEIMFEKFETELFTNIYSVVYQNIFYSAHSLHDVWTSGMLPRFAWAWL